MADERIRKLERSEHECPDLLRERLRRNTIASRALLCASYLGSAAANEALEGRGPQPNAMQRQSRKPYMEGLLDLAGDAEWEPELRRVMVEGAVAGSFPVWIEETLVNHEGEVADRLLAPIRALVEPSAGLPTREGREACGAILAELWTEVRALLDAEHAATSKPRYSNDPIEEGIYRKHYDEDTKTEEFARAVSRGRWILERLDPIHLEGKVPDRYNALQSLDSAYPWTDAKPRLEAHVIQWLLGPQGPSAGDTSDVSVALAPVTEGLPEDDPGLVAALEALQLKSPAKRMFIADLRRLVDGGKDLSQGQRERATKILSDA